MSKHATVRPICGFRVVRLKRGHYEVPRVIDERGNTLKGDLKSVTAYLKQLYSASAEKVYRDWHMQNFGWHPPDDDTKSIAEAINRYVNKRISEQ